MQDPGSELLRILLPRLSEKSKRSLPCSLTEHQNGTFRPIFASQHVQIRAQSVVRTPFRTVSLGSRVNKAPLSSRIHREFIGACHISGQAELERRESYVRRLRRSVPGRSHPLSDAKTQRH